MTAFNQSRVKMFRRCQKQYSFRYDSWKQFGGPEQSEMVPKVHKVQLQRGTWLHALLETHHRAWAVDSGFDPQVVYGSSDGEDIETWPEVHARFTEEFNALFEEEREELGDLPGECERIFKSYLRHWREDQQHYRVASLSDGSPAIEFVVEARFPEGFTRAPFKGRIDLVVEDLEYGGLWIWDHKTVKTVPAADERMMSPQAPMYIWAMQQDDYDMRGFIYNYSRTKAPTIPPVLKSGLITTRSRLDTDYTTYLKLVKEVHGDSWREFVAAYYMPKLRELKSRDVLWFRRERIPVEPERVDRALDEFLATVVDIKRRSKPPNPTPRSYFYNCKFGCEYHGICCAEFQGLDIEPLVKKNFQFTEERYADTTDLLKD